MPKETFTNLTLEKRSSFIREALREFARYNFESASINRIIKTLGIARGSVYQYFEDKLDLWLYLKDYCEDRKMTYIQSVNRDEYPDFWAYYSALYIRGIDFDLEQPLCSRFLYRVGFSENSAEVLPYLQSWKEKANVMFTHWVEAEKRQGTFNSTISTEIAVHFLINMSLSIADLLQSKYQVNFEANLQKGDPLFGNNKAELESAVKELVQLLEKALK